MSGEPKTLTLTLDEAAERVAALEAENARFREALVTTTRSLSTCEQSYRLGGGREYADKLRAVLRDAWAVLRDTGAGAGQ